MKKGRYALFAAALLSAVLFAVCGCGREDVHTAQSIPESAETVPDSAETDGPGTDGQETASAEEDRDETEENMKETQDAVPEKSWPQAEEKPFNRLSVTYTSEGPVRLTVSYTVFGRETEDVFYLEAGENEFK